MLSSFLWSGHSLLALLPPQLFQDSFSFLPFSFHTISESRVSILTNNYRLGPDPHICPLASLLDVQFLLCSSSQETTAHPLSHSTQKSWCFLNFPSPSNTAYKPSNSGSLKAVSSISTVCFGAAISTLPPAHFPHSQQMLQKANYSFSPLFNISITQIILSKIFKKKYFWALVLYHILYFIQSLNYPKIRVLWDILH